MGKKQLHEKDRLKLDNIVQQMIDNGESDEDIQFVVDDFKNKYAKKKDFISDGPTFTGDIKAETGIPEQKYIETTQEPSAFVGVDPFRKKVESLKSQLREGKVITLKEVARLQPEEKEVYIAARDEFKQEEETRKQEEKKRIRDEVIPMIDQLSSAITPEIQEYDSLMDASKKRYSDAYRITQNWDRGFKKYVSSPSPEVSRAYSQLQDEDMYQAKLMSQYGQFKDAKVLLDKSKEFLATEGEKGLKSFWKGLTNKTWTEALTFGYKELFDDLNVALVAKKQKEGKTLTEDEQALLAAKYIFQQLESTSEHGFGYKVGKGVAEMVPYMVQIALTRGAGTGVSKGAEAAVKKIAKDNVTSIMKKYGLFELAGVAGQAPFMSMLYEKAAEDYTGTFIKEDDEIVTKEGKSFKEAIWDAYKSTTTTLFTESLGGVLSGNVTKGINKAAQNTVKNKTMIEKAANELKKRAKWDGLGYEWIEEQADMILQPLVDDKASLNQLFDLDSQLEMATTLAITYGTFKFVEAPRAIKEKVDAKQYENTKKVFEENIPVNIQEHVNDAIKKGDLTSLKDVDFDGLSGEQQSLVAKYINRSLKHNTIEKLKDEEYNQELKEKEEKQEVKKEPVGKVPEEKKAERIPTKKPEVKEGALPENVIEVKGELFELTPEQTEQRKEMSETYGSKRADELIRGFVSAADLKKYKYTEKEVQQKKKEEPIIDKQQETTTQTIKYDQKTGIEAEKKVLEELKTLKKERLTDRENEIKDRLRDRFARLGGAKFALKEGDKNPNVLEDLVGVVADMSELGLIQVEKGIDHITTKLKEYLPNIDPENIDKYKEDLANQYDIIKPEKVEEPTMTKTQAEKETDKKAALRQEAQEPLTLGEPTRFDKFITKIQNRYRRVDQLVNKAKKGQSIADNIDPSLQLELLPGKAKKRIEDKEQEILKGKPKGEKSLADRARKDGVNLDELGTYMLAKHAPERNAQKFKERNQELDEKIKQAEKKMSETDNKGAKTRYKNKIEALEKQKIKQTEIDILNEKAKAFVDKIENSDKSDKYQQYSEEVKDRLIKVRQDALVEYGLVDQGLVDELNTLYPNYVPYHVLSKQLEKGVPGTRQLDVKGRDIYRAKNLVDIEMKDRSNPIIQSLFEYDKTVVRGEKNAVDRSLLGFAEEVDNDIIEVINPKHYKKITDEGYIETIPTGLEEIPEDEQLHLKVKGKPVVLHIKDKPLMRAMKGSGVARSINALNKVNNYLRFVNTLWNPEFVITNLTRDLQTATINITAEDKKGLKRKFAKNVPLAMRGIWQNERGKETQWANIVEELKDFGGEIGWLNTENIEELSERLRQRFNKYNHNKSSTRLKSALNSLADYIESVNKVVEMGSRVAAYKAAVDSGISKEQAARLAKNLTVNFNKKGELGSLIDSLYLFANAGIQGTAILLKNVAKSPKVRTLVSGIVAGSILLNYMNDAINEDEYDKIPEGIKERNLIIMHPDGNYTKIPLPYGYNIFKNLGDRTYNIIEGKENFGEASIGMLKTLDASFNPISSSSLGQMISPTLLDPFVQVSENKNWFGSPVKPEQPPYTAEIPESQLYFGSVRPLSKKITEEANKLSGGTKSIKGWLDISPEYIDHFTDYVGGGLGRFINNSVNLGGSLIKGEDVATGNIPFVRQFTGTPSEKSDLGFIYEMKRKSWTKEFSKEEKQKYVKALRNMFKKGYLSSEDFGAYFSDFMKGQRSIKLSRQYPNLTRQQLRQVLSNEK